MMTLFLGFVPFIILSLATQYYLFLFASQLLTFTKIESFSKLYGQNSTILIAKDQLKVPFVEKQD
jgi:hypothetical protein